VSRTADEPGQALNVDLCFVPVSHLVDVKLPAVSGSSGHLVVERLKAPGQEPDYPGRVFADPELDYVEAVQAFVQASRPLFGSRPEAAPAQQTELQQVRQAEDQLRLERRNLRKRRAQEDTAWRVTWSQQRYQKPSAHSGRNPNRVPVGVLAKCKKNNGKTCANNIDNSRSNVNRKTNSGACTEKVYENKSACCQSSQPGSPF
jgi:hypothetical protein